MPTLPDAGSLSLLPDGVQIMEEPSLTWGIDRETKRIQGEITGYNSVKQHVDAILHIERFRWQIYLPSSGMQWDGLIGQDPGYVAAEVQRRMLDALLMDDRVRGISNFEWTMDGEDFRASVTVNTVYGDVQTDVEVTLS